MYFTVTLSAVFKPGHPNSIPFKAGDGRIRTLQMCITYGDLSPACSDRRLLVTSTDVDKWEKIQICALRQWQHNVKKLQFELHDMFNKGLPANRRMCPDAVNSVERLQDVNIAQNRLRHSLHSTT